VSACYRARFHPSQIGLLHPLLYCRWLPDAPKEGELKLNSLFYELGENSYMKEVVAYQVGAASQPTKSPSNFTTYLVTLLLRFTARTMETASPSVDVTQVDSWCLCLDERMNEL
jgi:hypothetical protein